MKEKAKALEADNGLNCSDYNNYNCSCSSNLTCKKHPSLSNVGICAQCLKDKLIKLVCSDCGERRLPSCSCSDISSSSYRNSSCTMEVGSVERISLLIDNDKTESTQCPTKHPTKKDHLEGRETEEVILLKRSNSCCAEVNKSQRVWRIGRFFSVKGSRTTRGCDYMDVSRCRSLCRFRGSVFTDQEGSEFANSSTKISDVNLNLALNESEPRKSSLIMKKGFESTFPVKESDFRGMDESGFIDLKFDLSTTEFKSEFRKSHSPLSASDFVVFRGEKFLEEFENEGYFGNERRGLGSCRITVNNDRGSKKGGKGNKVWNWIFKSNHGWRSSSSRRKDVNDLLKV